MIFHKEDIRFVEDLLGTRIAIEALVVSEDEARRILSKVSLSNGFIQAPEPKQKFYLFGMEFHVRANG